MLNSINHLYIKNIICNFATNTNSRYVFNKIFYLIKITSNIMKTLDVKVNEGKVTLNLPTKLSEITKEWLTSVTNSITPAPNYSIIALVLKDSIAMLLNAKRKNNQMVAGVSVFVKTSSGDNSYLSSIPCGTPVVVAPSDISMGNHIIAPKNTITPGKIASLIEGDKELKNKIFLDNQTIFTVEFKLVPNSAIHGDIIEDNTEFEDPFVKIITTDNIVLN